MLIKVNYSISRLESHIATENSIMFAMDGILNNTITNEMGTKKQFLSPNSNLEMYFETNWCIID